MMLPLIARLSSEGFFDDAVAIIVIALLVELFERRGQPMIVLDLRAALALPDEVCPLANGIVQPTVSSRRYPPSR
jgi:hypothetical protein